MHNCTAPDSVFRLFFAKTNHRRGGFIENIWMKNVKAGKTQLKTTRLPVKEIAFSLGFNNHSFFNKYFRKQVKMTPLEYREK